MSPLRCNFNRLKLLENLRLDDDLKHSIDRLNNLRFVQTEDRPQNLNLDKFRRPNTNPNLEGIIKGSVINTPFYSTSSQFPHSHKFLQKNLILQQILIWDTSLLKLILKCMIHNLT